MSEELSDEEIDELIYSASSRIAIQISDYVVSEELGAPSLVAIGCLMLGAFLCKNSGYITKEHFMQQCENMWEAEFLARPDQTIN